MLITLCTDMGLQDHYVASVKATLMAEAPNAQVIDISHQIPKFDIARAAFVLRNVYQEFPKGSIHIIGVLPEADSQTAHVVVKHKGHYFIAADNGLFSFLFETEPEEVFEITVSQDTDLLTFPTKYVFAQAAGHLARGGTPEIIGRASRIKNRLLSYMPLTDIDTIRGHVIHIDSYGNVITNITRQMHNEVGRGRTYEINFGSYRVSKIHRSYNEVPQGEKLAIFGGSGFLEIAINKGTIDGGGGANTLLGNRVR